MESGTATVTAADLLMACDEEMLDVFPSPQEKHKVKEDTLIKDSLSAFPSPHQTDMLGSVSLKEEEEELNSAPVRVIPIPVQPVTTHNPLTSKMTVKPAGSTLGFTVNGRPVPFQSLGGKTELRLCTYPRGSASGFTTIQMPVTLTIHNPTFTRFVTTPAPQTVSVTPFSPLTPPLSEVAPPPEPESIPIITGVVSGEAAQKVLNDHNVDFKFSTLKSQETPPSAVASTSKPKKRSKSRTSNKLTAPDKLLRKGEVEPITPPNCKVCLSQYKLINELRGFMCMCSPAIALSLQTLRKQRIKRQRRKREQQKFLKASRGLQISSPNKATKVQQGPQPVKSVTPPQKTCRISDEFLSDDFSSPASDTVSQPQDQSLSDTPPPSKLVILLEDFYYGHAEGNMQHRERFSRPFRCIHCSKSLRNNIKLMDHVQQHIWDMAQQNKYKDSVSPCPHCFRNFSSPFRLQCHMEIVHSQYQSSVICKICELAFDNEPAFMYHMKSTHQPGEMPYFCQVCDYRSSFYSDIWSHFRMAHADSRNLMCPYCLRVLRLTACYQKHIIRHQKKHVLSCNKCRLHFLYLKERAEHKALHHKTHVTPPQLKGLKPGTKVTVRTYSDVKGPEGEATPGKSFVPCKVVQVTPPPPPQEDIKRKPIESLGSLLSGLSTEGDGGCSQHCIECLNLVSDLKVHFPTLVHCSLCKFSTCCSTSYANHMINNHTTVKDTQFATIFLSNPSLSQVLKCASCTFSTYRGDVMANHLMDRPDHVCSMSPGEGQVSIKSSQEEASLKRVIVINTKRENISSQGSGAFVPIHLVPHGQRTPTLSVKPLRPTSTSSLFQPAMSIKVLGPQKPKDFQLSLSQLSVVLASLCHGISETSRRFETPPATIRSWIAYQQRGLTRRKWCWRTDKMAEWVLNRREQQMSVGEDVLLLTAKATLGEGITAEECYSWTIDFMLRHDLGLQTTNNNKLKSVQDNSRMFIQSLYSQIQSGILPLHCWGCMDELPVFINSDLFSKQNSAAFQLFGLLDDKPTFDIIISALSDGAFLPPLLFFTGTPSEIPEGFPNNVLLETREEGFSDEDRLQIWIDKVWSTRVTSKNNRESLLVVDVHRGHLNPKFKEGLTAVETDLAFIPPGCSCRLQPLEICVTQVLRDFLQARWAQLVSEGGLDDLGLNQLALTLACWLSEVTSTLNSETDILRRSFSLACSLQPVDGQGEVARMITALTESLVQPLDTEEPSPEPKHKPEPVPLKESLIQPLDTKEPSPEPKHKPEPEPLKKSLIQPLDTEEPSPEPKHKPEPVPLTESLIQPLDTEEPSPEPKCKSEPEPLKESLIQPMDTEEPSPEPKHKSEPEPLTESLIQPMDTEEPSPEPKHKSEADPQLEVKEEERSEQESSSDDEEFSSSPSALRQVFDGESDEDSFQGFSDD